MKKTTNLPQLFQEHSKQFDQYIQIMNKRDKHLKFSQQWSYYNQLMKQAGLKSQSTESKILQLA